MLLLSTSALLTISLGFFSTTNAFQTSFSAESYDSQLFTPLESLSHLSTNEYTALSHPLFPKYGVRIKKTEGWCDPDANGYTGYIDIQARHLFFYFFESRNDPAKDDVIFWTNGGPGCSSSLGLLMELGPCSLTSSNATKPNPHSWNANANIFFVDQPIGVGFSYADYGETVGSTPEAAQDIAAFVAIFFFHFSSFQGRPFHMAGESYALPKINLQSVMIGNGITDFYTLWLKESCIDSYDAINCVAAYTFCDTELATPFWLAERNPYDMSRSCSAEELSTSLCYPVIDVPVNFSICSPSVAHTFALSHDELQPALLQRGIKALIYVGNLDGYVTFVTVEGAGHMVPYDKPGRLRWKEIRLSDVVCLM
ncbi:Alpha/Beta hydrolase protein [Cyathus striatus]|nr:Alpha/Beta hydrolase protein [Cyathus striatus]